MDEAAIRQLKVTELRAELSKLGLPTTGKKDELITRMLEACGMGDAQPSTPSAVATPLSQNRLKSPLPSNSQPSSDPHINVSTSSGDSRLSVGKVMGATDDRMASRATRFNLEPTEDARRKQRAERFGSNAEAEELFDEERMRARQARFGVISSDRLAKAEDEAARLRRLERFGLNSK